MVQERVTVSQLQAEDWTEEHRTTVKRFLADPTTRCLFFYKDIYRGFCVDTAVPPFILDQVDCITIVGKRLCKLASCLHALCSTTVGRRDVLCIKSMHTETHARQHISSMCSTLPYQGFSTRMVYLYYISCLRYTILVGNP